MPIETNINKYKKMNYEVINIQTGSGITFSNVEVSMDDKVFMIRENTRGGNLLGVFPLTSFYIQYIPGK